MIAFLQMIDGKKTYILSCIMAFFVVIEFIIKGDFSMMACIGLMHNTAIVAVVATIRHAIQKQTPTQGATT